MLFNLQAFGEDALPFIGAIRGHGIAPVVGVGVAQLMQDFDGAINAEQAAVEQMADVFAVGRFGSGIGGRGSARVGVLKHWVLVSVRCIEPLTASSSPEGWTLTSNSSPGGEENKKGGEGIEG